MLNLNEMDKFVLVPQGSYLELANDKRRVVKLELNTSEPCQLRLQVGSDDYRFLANVHGRETISFVADGPVGIWPDCDGEVWWWCPEMESTHVQLVDEETFTRVANRRQRNPELERMMQKMHENAERRMAQVVGEVRGVVDGLRTENETLKAEVKKRGKRKGAGDADAGGGTGETPAEVPDGAEATDLGGGDEAGV